MKFKDYWKLFVLWHIWLREKVGMREFVFLQQACC